MNKHTLNKIIAMYVIAVGIDGSPNGYVYVKMMSQPVDGVTVDLDLHTAIVGALKQDGMMTESNHFLTLTEKGRKVFDEVVKVLLETPAR